MNGTEDYQREMTFFRSHLELCNTGISKPTWFCYSAVGKSQRVYQLVFMVSCNSNKARKKTFIGEVLSGLQRPLCLETPTQTWQTITQFCASCYHLRCLITKINFKGMCKKYLLSSALPTRMLAVVSLCKEAVIKTRFPSCLPNTFG